MVCERVAVEGVQGQLHAPLASRLGADDERLERDGDSDDTDLEEEMMRVDPADLEWRRQLHEGDALDAQNVFGNWCPALLQRILDGDARVQFLSMNDSWTRWLPLDSGQLAPPGSKARNDGAPLRLAQPIEVRPQGSGLWKEALVVRARGGDVFVRYPGRQLQFDEWVPLTPATVAPAGEHVPLFRSRAAALAQRQQPVDAPATTRCRVIEPQNPRFRQYRDALAARGLRIHTVEGDGNCLFRSVSHQLYGDDAHHALVRSRCMDYMESEKEYFEPYVVGDMAAFLRYLAHKRRNGVWGDDPEIQALCELYDRPAEVFAYDAAQGCRTLRTFHENSALARNRPPIRLSYYGGGHYDSLVGDDHAANVIREPPGDWERRHLGFSRRINTREAQGDDTSGVASQVLAESDREVTEVEQLEHILMLSRHEFDAMNSNLEETLKLSLAESEASANAIPAAAAAARREEAEVEEATRESEMAAIQAQLIAKAKEASEDEQMRAAIQASLASRPAPTAGGDFDADVDAAIAESLRDTGGAARVDYDEQLRRAMELSAHEYSFGDDPNAAGLSDHAMAGAAWTGANEAEADELDELQRAIQASLQQS